MTNEFFEAENRDLAERSFDRWDGETFSRFSVPASCGLLEAVVPGDAASALARLRLDDPVWRSMNLYSHGTWKVRTSGTGLRVRNRLYMRVRVAE